MRVKVLRTHAKSVDGAGPGNLYYEGTVLEVQRGEEQDWRKKIEKGFVIETNERLNYYDVPKHLRRVNTSMV